MDKHRLTLKIIFKSVFMTLLKIKNLLKIIFFNIIILLIGIFVLEIIFGNWIKHDNLNLLNIPRSISMKYNIEGLYPYHSKTITYTRDKYGLRGSFNSPDEIDILTVGGSTTDQRYISDGETWQDILQKEFKKIGKDIMLANAGIDGQSTYGHIKNFEWWFPNIPKLEPKYILFYIGINDFYVNEGNGFDNIYYKKNSIRNIIKEKSALYYFLRTLAGIYKAQIKNKIGHRSINVNNYNWTTIPLCKSYDKILKIRVKEYSERLEILCSQTKKIGSIPIFVTQPTYKYKIDKGEIFGIDEKNLYDNIQINGVDYYNMMRIFDDVIFNISNKNNSYFIDAAKSNIWQSNDFYDLAHMTPGGARKLGNLLFEKLKLIIK